MITMITFSIAVICVFLILHAFTSMEGLFLLMTCYVPGTRLPGCIDLVSGLDAFCPVNAVISVYAVNMLNLYCNSYHYQCLRLWSCFITENH